jgi:hypothetical protein
VKVRNSLGGYSQEHTSLFQTWWFALVSLSNIGFVYLIWFQFFYLYKFLKLYVERTGFSIIGSKSVPIQYFHDTIFYCQPSRRGTELTFESQTFMKNVAFFAHILHHGWNTEDLHCPLLCMETVSCSCVWESSNTVAVSYRFCYLHSVFL